jgi:hypothetical protein
MMEGADSVLSGKKSESTAAEKYCVLKSCIEDHVTFIRKENESKLLPKLGCFAAMFSSPGTASKRAR